MGSGQGLILLALSTTPSGIRWSRHFDNVSGMKKREMGDYSDSLILV
jgi:hypothetical protein